MITDSNAISSFSELFVDNQNQAPKKKPKRMIRVVRGVIIECNTILDFDPDTPKTEE